MSCTDPTLCEGTTALGPMIAIALVLWIAVIALYVEFEVRRNK